MMKIGLSIYKNRNWENMDIEFMLDVVRKTGTKYAELVFAWPEELYAELSEKSKKWLKNLEFLSIHAPYKGEISERDIGRLASLGKELQAKTFVFHPPFEFSKLEGSPLPYSIENLRKIRGYDLEYVGNELEKNTELGLCLDISHTFSFSDKELAKYVNLFQKRISHVHLSGYIDGKEHTLISDCSKDFTKKLEPLKGLDVPFILEIDWFSRKAEDMRKEMDYIQDLFKK
jgi:hypothetical protein